MLPEKWQEIVGKIKDSFSVEASEKRHYDEAGGTDVESIIFSGPLGRMKLEFIVKPVVLDRKTRYSNRAGQQTVIEYVYSPEEKSHKLKAYKWDEAAGDWLEMKAGKFEF